MPDEMIWANFWHGVYDMLIVKNEEINLFGCHHFETIKMKQILDRRCRTGTIVLLHNGHSSCPFFFVIAFRSTDHFALIQGAFIAILAQ